MNDIDKLRDAEATVIRAARDATYRERFIQMLLDTPSATAAAPSTDQLPPRLEQQQQQQTIGVSRMRDSENPRPEETDLIASQPS